MVSNILKSWLIDCSFLALESTFSPELKPCIRRPGLQKRFNPELEISLGDISVKFHHQSLSHVIECELAVSRRAQLSVILDWPGLQNCELIFLRENEMLLFDPQSLVSHLVRNQMISETAKFGANLIFEHRETKLQFHLKELHRTSR